MQTPFRSSQAQNTNLPGSAGNADTGKMLSFTPFFQPARPSAVPIPHETDGADQNDGQPLAPALPDSAPLGSRTAVKPKAPTELGTADGHASPSGELGSPSMVAPCSALLQLVNFCQQQEDRLPGMDALLAEFCDSSLGFTKVGEGMLGEAYRCGKTVFKIMPMEGEMLVNGASQKQADEILAEAKIAHTLSGLRTAAPGDGDAQPENATAGFVELKGVGVCKGLYSRKLEAEWRRWDKEHSSENDAVDCFDDNQV
jgi:hypothetical protein